MFRIRCSLRAWALFALLALAVAVVACGGGDDTPAPDAPADASVEDSALPPPPNGQDATVDPEDAYVAPVPDAASTDAADAQPDTGGTTNLAPAPTLASVAPSQAVVGSPGPTIVCTGTNFVARSVVQVDGVALTTSFVSATELRATIPDGKLAQVGTVHVTVGTPPPGGGGSMEVAFQVVNPAPGLTALAPASVPVGTGATLLTVKGSSFQSGSVLSFAGTPLATTFLSATSLTATIPAGALTTSGSDPVIVTNPAPGGGVSSSIAFIVSNPTVNLQTVTPSTIVYGSAATPLALVGVGFVAASSVSFNGAKITTNFTDATHLAATVPASALLAAGSFPVVVTNPAPGGGVSAPALVNVNYPGPVASSLQPPSVLVGAPPPTVVVMGTGFLAGVSTIAFNGTTAPTTLVDATHVSATLTTQLVSKAGTVLVTVSNPAPGGGTSSALPFTVDEPAPVATGISPPSALVGAGDTAISVTGSTFVAQSSVLLGGSPLATTFVDAQTLTATIPAASLLVATKLSVAVSTPGPGGGTSAPLSFVVDNPGPTVNSLSPSLVVVPAGDTPVVVSGVGFLAGVSTVDINDASVPATFNNGALDITIPSAALQTAGTLSLTVVNPSPGGGTSNAAFFSANDPAPVLNSVTPPSIIFGSPATSIALVGSGFVAGSVVNANGMPITSTFVDGADLSATIPASMLLTGSVTITVINAAPGGGTSAGKTITVGCDTTAGADVVLSQLNNPSVLTLSLTSSSAPVAHRITKTEVGYKCPSTDDTSTTNDPTGTEPYAEYLVQNDTLAAVTLDAWAVCGPNDDGFVAFYATSTKPTTQTALAQCATYVSEGTNGAGPASGGFASPEPGSSLFCPGLTKSNGGGLSLAACASAVVLIQAYSTTDSLYTPPATLKVQIE